MSAVRKRSLHGYSVSSKPLALLSDFNPTATSGLPSRAINSH